MEAAAWGLGPRFAAGSVDKAPRGHPINGRALVGRQQLWPRGEQPLDESDQRLNVAFQVGKIDHHAFHHVVNGNRLEQPKIIERFRCGLSETVNLGRQHLILYWIRRTHGFQTSPSPFSATFSTLPS